MSTPSDPAAMRRVEITRRHDLLDASGAPISAKQRWAGLLAEDAPVVRALVHQGLAFARQHAPEWLRKAATWLAFQGLVRKLDRWYVAEITAIAETLGFSVYDMAMIQQQYTWGHLGGCTTTAFWDERRGEAVHARSLDWAMVDELSAATRVLECFGRTQDSVPRYRAAAVAGAVGLLTAVKPGAFSVSINYSPWKGVGYFMDPTVRLREVMDDPGIDSFARAVDALSNPRRTVGAAVFFTVCGTRPEEISVIEWSRPPLLPWMEGECHHRGASRSEGGRLIVQANHHDLGGPWAKRNRSALPYAIDDDKTAYEAELEETSLARQLAMDRAVRRGLADPQGPLPSVLAALRVPPVWNHETTQWVVMRPASGQLEAWARTGS